MFNLSDLAKDLKKKIPEISIGHSRVNKWISTGNYALNYRISGDFKKGIPYGKVTMFAGEPFTGKSYLVSGSIVKHALLNGDSVVLVDTEGAIDEEWLLRVGIPREFLDPEKGRFVKIETSMINALSQTFAKIIESYKNEYGEDDDAPGLLLVVDSLGMLTLDETQQNFEKGDVKSDMGRKAQTLKTFVQRIVSNIANTNIGMVATNHVYESMDIFSKKKKISGGSSFVYASSIVVEMTNKLVKGDDKKPKGVLVNCLVSKTRFTRPFESTSFEIPFDSPLDPYSGLVELLVEDGFLKKKGNRLLYVDSEGKEYVKFREHFKNDKDLLDLIMEEISSGKVRKEEENYSSDNEDLSPVEEE